MMNDNPCRVDQFGVHCDEHQQDLIECALVLQQVRQLQIRILNQWRESHGDCRELMLGATKTCEEARLRLASVTADRDALAEMTYHLQKQNSELEASISHLQDYLKKVELQATTMRDLLKQVL